MCDGHSGTDVTVVFLGYNAWGHPVWDRPAHGVGWWETETVNGVRGWSRSVV